VAGHFAGSLNAAIVPSRDGPRHCGQSCAAAAAPIATIPNTTPATRHSVMG